MKVKSRESDLGPRAMAAWFRSGGRDQPAGPIMEHEIGGKRYVVLENCNGLMAVYRYRLEIDRLKALRRWPDVINQIVDGTYRDEEDQQPAPVAQSAALPEWP